VNNPAGGPVDSDPWHAAALPGGAFLVSDAGGNSLLRVDPVPEPETWLLMAVGFAGIGWLRRRARRADR